MGAAVMLRREGYEDLTVFERGERIGGVWNYNTYPGAACDVPSHLYEFSFAPNPRWSRRYAPQAEIQAYVEDVARSHGVLDRIRTGTEVLQARWEGERGKWLLETSAGLHEADVLLTACGQLSVPSVPPLPGLDSFAGPSFHTARWPEGLELAGKRVAVIGTGCSAIQVGPAIQPRGGAARHLPALARLDVPADGLRLQRTSQAPVRALPVVQRLDRMSILAFHELGAVAMTRQTWLRGTFRSIGRRQINKLDRGSRAAPQGHAGRRDRLQAGDGHRRLVPDADQAQRRADHHPDRRGDAARSAHARRRRAPGRRAGARHRLQDPRLRRPHGRDRCRWPHAGPGVVRSRQGVPRPERARIPEHVPALRAQHQWRHRVGDLHDRMRHAPRDRGGRASCAAAGATTIEVRREAAEAFDRELRDALAKTVWHTGCTNWYVDENGNDPNQWPWLWSTYRRRTAQIPAGTYELAAPPARTSR